MDQFVEDVDNNHVKTQTARFQNKPKVSRAENSSVISTTKYFSIYWFCSGFHEAELIIKITRCPKDIPESDQIAFIADIPCCNQW